MLVSRKIIVIFLDSSLLVFMIDTSFIRSSTNSVEGKRMGKPGCWLECHLAFQAQIKEVVFSLVQENWHGCLGFKIGALNFRNAEHIQCTL